MKLISRSELGWPATASAYWPTANGVKIHYEGTPVHITDHSQCMSHWTSIRNSHLANTSEGYVDVAYNFAVCLHGYVLEGRGLRRKTGANGNQTLNGDHYAVVAFLGDDGDTQPTRDMLNGLRDAIEYFQANGAGPEIKGHRDGYATSCPGQPLYDWVSAGAPRPNNPQENTDMPSLAIGYVPKTESITIPLPPLGTAAGWSNKWISFASDHGVAKLRIAIFNSGTNSWRVSVIDVDSASGRVNADLVSGDEKISIERAPGDANGPVSWMVEAR